MVKKIKKIIPNILSNEAKKNFFKQFIENQIKINFFWFAIVRLTENNSQ
jgi:hypothetical protein